MAKKSKKKAAPAKKAKKTAAAEAPAFGIAEAAKEAGVSPAHLRLQLRNAGVKKSGKSYGWSSQAAMKADLKKVRAEAAAA